MESRPPARNIKFTIVCTCMHGLKEHIWKLFPWKLVEGKWEKSLILSNQSANETEEVDTMRKLRLLCILKTKKGCDRKKESRIRLHPGRPQERNGKQGYHIFGQHVCLCWSWEEQLAELWELNWLKSILRIECEVRKNRDSTCPSF